MEGTGEKIVTYKAAPHHVYHSASNWINFLSCLCDMGKNWSRNIGLKKVNSVDEVRITCLGVRVSSDVIYINGFVPVENVSL